ncbi:MAG: RNase adapter RapZ [Lachnospiraceae bacterium]|nr:RNase adapter RapZ [Lachnospiraceae bacterium]MCI5587481.1 RNase adapter RapZ [Lachnospiraceae bacterium]
MRFVIVTGMSGAGKSSVLKMLEDMGYFCVDNLPVRLIPKLTKIAIEESDSIDRAALGIDIRNLQGLSELDDILDAMKEAGYRYEILFLDADSNVLIKRYKETRRNHPLALQGRVDKAIEAEREELAFIKKRADYIMDTSHMLVRELKHEIDRIFLDNDEYENFFVTILSFGFKYGIPEDSDLVFDVRFLPNPYYIPELKPLTGNDHEVYDYVMESEQARIFDKKLFEMISFLIPNYITEGKNQLVISIGCTGGKHRSVTIANALAKHMKQLPYSIKVEHRDIDKDAVTKGE